LLCRCFSRLGPCQFPTLGFVVDRFWQIKCFTAEPFYVIKCRLEKGDEGVDLLWDRVRLFDKPTAVICYDLCMESGTAIVTSIDAKDTTK
jgi:DNA topoisomerase-3